MEVKQEEKNYSEKCFAEYEGRNSIRCGVLTYKRCIGHEKCVHYKSERQCEIEKRQTFEKLRKLPRERQKHIEEKYGIKIWGEF